MSKKIPKKKPAAGKPRLVLASTSKARRRLLKKLGLPFDVESPGIDELPFQKSIKEPRRLVTTLAIEKARAVSSRRPDDVVIGSDQMMVCGRKVFGQPGTLAKARAQLKACSGQTIELLTAVCVIGPGGEECSFAHVTMMTFRELSEPEIRDYVAEDRPVECAGSFKFELAGPRLFKSVETDDPTAIEGLPLLHVHGILKRVLSSADRRRPR